ncbi:MAG: hypothetical protein V8T12_01010 [Parabacteroides johnsonii]
MSVCGLQTRAPGLAFQIDTAWVGRGHGYIKPQYLISVNHKDFEGVEGSPCTEVILISNLTEL